MKTQQINIEPLPASVLFAVGDRVKISAESEYSYEVAEIRRFPHGDMVGIYDEPPSKHVDWWNPTSLHTANAKDQPTNPAE